MHVTADHPRAPIRGRVSAVLLCERHPEFWQALGLDHIELGHTRTLTRRDLSTAWAAMPITPADVDLEHPTPPASSDADSAPTTPQIDTERLDDARS